MDTSLKKVEVLAFDAARIEAIDKYALLEHRLAWILSLVLRIDWDKANVIFYRVVNARSRMGILMDLLEKSPNADTKPYWRSVEKEIVRIDGLRNRIVHYSSVYDHGTVGGAEPAKPSKSLVPGLDFTSDSRLTFEDLKAFIAKVQSLSIELIYYGHYLRGGESESEALRQIFLRPRDGQTRHALEAVLFPTAPPPPPQSSQA